MDYRFDKENIRKTIGENIKKARVAKGLTQKDLAEILDVNSSNLPNWEKGLYSPGIETLFQISDVLGVTVNEIYGLEKEQEKNPFNQEKVISAFKTVGLEKTEIEKLSNQQLSLIGQLIKNMLNDKSNQ